MTVYFRYTRPWMYLAQEAAVFNPARHGLIEGPVKSGKTYACLIWLFEQAYQGPSGANYWWVAPTDQQAAVVFNKMLDCLPEQVLNKVYKSSRRIILVGNRTIWFKSGSGRLQDGIDVSAAVIDQASHVPVEAFHAVLVALAATQGPTRIASSFRKGGVAAWFRNLCQRAKRGDPGFGYSMLACKDAVEAGVLTKAEVETAKADLPKSVFKELYGSVALG